METTSWVLTIIILSTLHGICTWKLYVTAGKKAWEAFIPVYNGIKLMEIINRPKWWVLLLFIPVINLLLLPVIWIETLRSFGRKSSTDMWLGVLTFGFYIGYINYTQSTTFEPNRSTKPATKALDTLGSITFAIIVATFVHTYFIQPFVIPTSSLEKTLKIGDFLFVSKFHYGARTPMTTVAAPMVHDTLPIIKTKSYSSWPELPYFRFPALQKIERNDIVVFNWPVDTVAKFRDNSGIKYYKPIDKKSNYVKRCVGIPGDEITIKNSDLYVNGKLAQLPHRAKPQFSYKVAFDGTNTTTTSTLDATLRELECSDGFGVNDTRDTLFIRALTDEGAKALKGITGVKSVEKILAKGTEKSIFPYTKNWNVDNLGPIKIPSQGETVTLNAETVPFYKMIITEYEHHQLQVNGNEIRIDGKPATSYTFNQDYYWMMGDNRHNSEDSRYWGFVPADHIVGKPIFIWMSFDLNNVFQKPFLDRFRPERFFTTVSGDGEPQSYFKYFLFALAGYFVWDYFNKKKKKKEEA